MRELTRNEIYEHKLPTRIPCEPFEEIVWYAEHGDTGESDGDNENNRHGTGDRHALLDAQGSGSAEAEAGPRLRNLAEHRREDHRAA
jgi:hypothetical protein